MLILGSHQSSFLRQGLFGTRGSLVMVLVCEVQGSAHLLLSITRVTSIALYLAFYASAGIKLRFSCCVRCLPSP